MAQPPHFVRASHSIVMRSHTCSGAHAEYTYRAAAISHRTPCSPGMEALRGRHRANTKGIGRTLCAPPRCIATSPESKEGARRRLPECVSFEESSGAGHLPGADDALPD